MNREDVKFDTVSTTWDDLNGGSGRGYWRVAVHVPTGQFVQGPVNERVSDEWLLSRLHRKVRVNEYRVRARERYLRNVARIGAGR